MEAFETYVAQLEAFATAALRGDESALKDVDLGPVLNGAVARQLRDSVLTSKLQEKGAFFTPAHLKAAALAPVLAEGIPEWTTWDPACGAGDLLLGVAQHLPVLPSLVATISSWSACLFGSDIEPVFLRAARARLVLAAYDRGARRTPRTSIRPLSELFPGLRFQDALDPAAKQPLTSFVVLNPPFIDVPSPDRCAWSSGSTSAAAVIVERCLVLSQPGTRIVAILPDVLRSGSRYSAWRRMVESHAELRRIQVYGIFDPTADVDVFVLDVAVTAGQGLRSEATEDPRWRGVDTGGGTLGDFCTVSVGAVVPHRHEEVGPDRPYLHSSDAPPWGTVGEGLPRRRFAGTVFKPPFVVVRRTSSPGDVQRPVGTLVIGTEPVAVENHLLVVRPKHGRVRICRKILEVLRDPAAREWLDRRIRTRHLTVAALRELPWSA